MSALSTAAQYYNQVQDPNSNPLSDAASASEVKTALLWLRHGTQLATDHQNRAVWERATRFVGAIALEQQDTSTAHYMAEELRERSWSLLDESFFKLTSGHLISGFSALRQSWSAAMGSQRLKNQLHVFPGIRQAIRTVVGI